MSAPAGAGNNFHRAISIRRSLRVTGVLNFAMRGGLSLTHFFCLKKSAQVSGTF
jgi:hypothetical protein